MRALWLTVFFLVFIWSGIKPHDYYTWLLEVAPAVIGIVILALTEKSFPLTPLLYFLILLHCIVLMIGGHYTYAEVPFFEGLFGAERNNYDKVGHFMQGFVPAMIAREICIRKQVFNAHASTLWRDFFIVCFCLAFSALYELIEWWVALLSGTGADAFLGTQGYVWDTQSDMLLALIGAICALLTLRKIHNTQLKYII
ncbi:MAG: DUF2238 domain-containing protein [Pseudomonadales bacterium]|nr:DUF2238 domain-containing protein [Pseudomonadales bacterium]